jgi:hypothetical protein
MYTLIQWPLDSSAFDTDRYCQTCFPKFANKGGKNIFILIWCLFCVYLVAFAVFAAHISSFLPYLPAVLMVFIGHRVIWIALQNICTMEFLEINDVFENICHGI